GLAAMVFFWRRRGKDLAERGMSALRSAAPETPVRFGEAARAVSERVEQVARSAAATIEQPRGGAATARRQSKLAELRGKFDWLMSFSDDEIRDVAFLDSGAPMEG